MKEESERYLQLAGENDQLAEQVQAYCHGGFRGVSEWRVDKLKRKAAKQYVSPADFADAYAELGHKEETNPLSAREVLGTGASLCFCKATQVSIFYILIHATAPSYERWPFRRRTEDLSHIPRWAVFKTRAAGSGVTPT